MDNHKLEALAEYFKTKQQTIAVAESVTAGLLQFALSNIPEASRFFQGGITAYNIAQKYKYLAVEPIHALSVNCVSHQVADEMATNVCKLFGSNWGIGVTGYASPVPESGNRLFAYYSIVYDEKVCASGEIVPGETMPQKVQEEYVEYIMDKLYALRSSG